ncbi:O-linked N-acetylglucosamine transferase [Amycolatopsis sp. WQ 127309]|uniref:O-linked N-acetylglucosamine transferase n=1 Tax=Amycolatopsis sp. WQ 127309 TaxID=2932773 RepID=UPI001FF35CD9|nr:O-linked N-acetylglucosamine transferase [Amycolatopsis sp. WQ 127309]UOZ02738.1 O-linked N-acetylglucosamine transferase [Amycolatopsis sp. WQ 127309]
MHRTLNETVADPARTPPDDGRRDAALVTAADGVQADIFRLLTALGEHRAKSDALVEACVACLEAAQCVAGLVAGDSPAEHTTMDPRAQEAVHAMRAATLAVRFAVTE